MVLFLALLRLYRCAMRNIFLVLLLVACSGSKPQTANVVTKLAISSPVVRVHSLVRSDGGHPRAELIQGPDGKFYGVTWQNGPNDGGDELKSCSSNFYWGKDQQKYECPGTVYRVSADGSNFEVMHAFSILDYLGRNQDGYQPVAALTDGGDGWIYGTASKGGLANSEGSPMSTIRGCGTAYRINVPPPAAP